MKIIKESQNWKQLDTEYQKMCGRMDGSIVNNLNE